MLARIRRTAPRSYREYVKRLLAYLAAALVVADVGRAGYLAALASAPASADDVTVAVTLAAGLLLGLPSVALGVLVATRRPDNVVGLVLVIVGAVPVDVAASSLYNAAVAAGVALPVSALYEQLMLGSWMLFYVPPALLFLLVPDGRLPGPRWRWVVGGLLVTPVVFMVAAAFDPAPLPEPYTDLPLALRAPEGVATAILVAGAALLPVFLGLLVASFAAILVRYRRTANPVVRAQLKWFALGASFVPLTLLLCWAGYLILGRPDVVLIGLAVTYLAIPAATAIAVLRHDLYDVDRALSATVTYAAATGVLLAFYTAASFLAGVGAGGDVAGRRGRRHRDLRGRPGSAAEPAATLGGPPALPARPAALTAMDELRRGTHAGLARPEQLEAALRTALRDQALRVGYRLPGSTAMVDAGGRAVEPGPTDLAAPVDLAGQAIGVITSAGPTSRELLREVAAASALLVEVVRLRVEVTHALNAVDASRARLLVAGYEERRRLERDLHDGAQQRLVSLGMSAAAGATAPRRRHRRRRRRPRPRRGRTRHRRRRAAPDRPRPAPEQPGRRSGTARWPALVEHHAGADHARRVGRGPADRSGHDGLLRGQRGGGQRGQARRALHRSACESATMASTHRHDPGRRRAVVPWCAPAPGLAGLADRVAAAGGRLLLSSPRGGGTTVEAVLPCAS